MALCDSPSSFPWAVALGRPEKISLVLVWDLLDSPQLSGSEALISPVVYCGPHGTQLFRKPCLLVFKHCSGNATQARACTSNTDLLSSKTWHPVWVREGMRAETMSDECRIQLSHFRNMDDSSCQSIPHLHIGHGKCPFRSFCFWRKQVASANQNEEWTALTNEVIVTRHRYRDGLETKYAEILRFQAPGSGSPETRISSTPHCNRLPCELFEQLQVLLDPNSISENSWCKLASRLGMCGMKIRYFACQQSPAAAILEVFEEQNGNLRDLYNIMVAMGRSDCALVIEGFLNGTSRGHCCTLATSAPSQAGTDRPWNMNGKSTGSPQPGPLGQGSCHRELTKGERLSCSGWCSPICTGFSLHLNSGGRLHRC
ncbi:LOW QUALITY PROTEIN: UNC5C-like protein [Eretmochelys imbricata]